MKEIPLTQGRVALVDDDDYERVSQLKWHTQHVRRQWYALASPTHNTNIMMHRYLLGCPPGQEVDHINHDGLDNRRRNLRLCTNSQNQANNRKQLRPTSSRFKGVAWYAREERWQAKVKHRGRSFWLGLFDSEEEAARAYNTKAQELFGEFAYLNRV